MKKATKKAVPCKKVKVCAPVKSAKTVVKKVKIVTKSKKNR